MARCSNCAAPLQRPHRNGRCHACATYWTRHAGQERPRWLYDPRTPRLCRNCGYPVPVRTGGQGRCSACYVYLGRHGGERPAWMWNPRLARQEAHRA